MDALRALEDRVELLEALVDRASAQPSLGDHALAERLDLGGGDLRQRCLLAEGRDQPLLDLAPVVADRRRAPLAIELDVPHPLATGLAEGDVVARLRFDHHFAVPAGKDLGQPELGLGAGDVALRRPAPLRPGVAELALEALTVGSADLRVEDRAPGALQDAYESSWPGWLAHRLQRGSEGWAAVPRPGAALRGR
ncbi:MAG: hypothetical protein AABM42_12030 [Actinomycetota bacterium]